MIHHEVYKRCRDGERNCFAWTQRGCLVLTKTDFGTRHCPFYKSQAQFDREETAREKRRGEIEAMERRV